MPFLFNDEVKKSPNQGANHTRNVNLHPDFYTTTSSLVKWVIRPIIHTARVYPSRTFTKKGTCGRVITNIPRFCAIKSSCAAIWDFIRSTTSPIASVNTINFLYYWVCPNESGWPLTFYRILCSILTRV